ncbi:MAG: hypothetical protein JNL21_21860 [Myxococcales bacterium]|nr:hypothetical protein [Myxococcales bacterium]
MGSDLYDVEVQRVTDRTAVLGIEVVHPDAGPPAATIAFALMVLLELAPGDAPLAREVSLDDTMNAAWLRRFARGFVEDVRVVADHVPQTQDSALGWRGTMTITVTHPGWVAHLAPGMRDASRAFSETDTFDRHPPVSPRLAFDPAAGAAGLGRLASALLAKGAKMVRGALDPAARSGTIALPRELWLEHGPPRSTPRVVETAAHPASAYEPQHTMHLWAGAERLRTWHGRVVWHQRAGDPADHPSVDTVVVDGSTVYLLHASPGQTGVRVHRDGYAGRIGLARLREGAKVADRASLHELLRTGLPQLVSASRRGRQARLVLRVVPGIAPPVEIDSATAFYLLVAPLLPAPPPFGWMHLVPELAKAPLSDTLRSIASDEGRLPKLTDLIRLYHSDVVAGVDLASELPERRDLDALPFSEARALFESPWPRIEVVVTAYHEESVQHLDVPFEERPVVLRRWG